jgi:acid phosphatase type 7
MSKGFSSVLGSALGAVLLLGIWSCENTVSPDSRTPSLPAVVVTAASSNILVGAGDVAGCTSTGDERTAAVINGILANTPTATVFADGDMVYESGTAVEWANCYNPQTTWGKFKARTRPVLGDHEYRTAGARPTFDYWGSALGQQGKGYYSFDLGSWHIVVLNSNQAEVPTKVGSPQETWLRADLAATRKPCILALWHHPRFSSVTSGTPVVKGYVKPFWDDLYAVRADLVIHGNKHHYERFAPQDPNGNPTPNGIRQFIVGTGGKSTGPTPTILARNSQVRHGGRQQFGVLKLTLGAGTYSWRFVPVAGVAFTDQGSGTCHS